MPDHFEPHKTAILPGTELMVINGHASSGAFESLAVVAVLCTLPHRAGELAAPIARPIQTKGWRHL